MNRLTTVAERGVTSPLGCRPVEASLLWASREVALSTARGGRAPVEQNAVLAVCGRRPSIGKDVTKNRRAIRARGSGRQELEEL